MRTERSLVDDLIHLGLGVARVVTLVVTTPAIADDVEDHVALEGLAVLKGESRGARARLGVIAIDVKDRRLNDLGNIGRIEARPRCFRGGREAHLVVDDNVHRATDAIARKL